MLVLNEKEINKDFQQDRLKYKHLQLFWFLINFTTKNKRAHVETAAGHLTKLR